MALIKNIITLVVLLSSSNYVLGHGTITAVTGANGINAAGFGVIASTPRDGTKKRPFQQDTSVIDDKDISRGKTGVCGETLAGGNNDVQTQLVAAVNAGLPTTNANGQLAMTLHQINGDGAGPYTCDVSTDGGLTFTAATVTTNVPGERGRSRAKAQDFPLVMQVATTTACAGGPNGDACIARCRNPKGPFGSCVAFSMGTENATAAAAAASSTASAAAVASATEAAAANATETAAANSTETAAANSTETATASATETAAASATETAAATSATNTAAATSATDTAAASAKETPAAGEEDEDDDEDEDEEEAGDSGEGGEAPADSNIGNKPVSAAVSATNAKNSPKKRVINSRIAGNLAARWIDA